MGGDFPFAPVIIETLGGIGEVDIGVIGEFG